MHLITTKCLRWLSALTLMVLLAGNAMAQRNVTLHLNTASAPDTLSATSLIEVRGALDGVGGATLPDGNVIDWNENSTLEPANMGGDFWEVTFQIPDDTPLEFKFWSAGVDASGLGGWEDGDNHMIAAGTGDTTLAVHYFNKSGASRDYDWRPFESKTDSVGVWFRVYMNTESGTTGANYDRGDMSRIIGVRGAPEPGAGIDWGATNVVLSAETDTENTPGYDLWSGVAYFPSASMGMTQAYKFVTDDQAGAVGWEGAISDRTFVVPGQDTTLQWVFFDNSAAVTSMPVTTNIIFAVDLSPLESIGVFDRAREDTLEIRGSFNGWGCTVETLDSCWLQRVPGQDIFEAAIGYTAFPGTDQEYKFFLNFNDANFMSEFGIAPPRGWEEPISTSGANRRFVYDGVEGMDQDLGVFFYNDVRPGNVIPEGVSVDVTFHVKMDSAITNMAQPFVAGRDTVTLALGEDPIWGFTQGLALNDDGGIDTSTDIIQLTDDDQDGVYSGTMTVMGPTYSAIQYKYAHTTETLGTFATEEGGSFSEVGRRRTRYIVPNDDGSWPATHEFEIETYLPTGLLPVETNPVLTSVEDLGGELPTQATLSANYPNPFNPVTTIEYSINKVEHVSLKVFDVTGRVVATLVDGIQQPSNYRINFEAKDLASGVYLYRLEAASTTITRKMILLK